MSQIEGEVSEVVQPVELKPRVQTQKLAPYLGLTREEMTWAALAHGSILLTLLIGIVSGGVFAILGVIVPAIIWYAYRGKSDYVVDQARQATIFQLVATVGLIALVLVGGLALVLVWVVTGLLSAVLIGLVLIPVALILTLVYVVAIVGLPIAQVVYSCYAALETYNGRPFRYRWVADLIDRYLVQAQP
jgi:uncharacterized Tic20 family protein